MNSNNDIENILIEIENLKKKLEDLEYQDSLQYAQLRLLELSLKPWEKREDVTRKFKNFLLLYILSPSKEEGLKILKLLVRGLTISFIAFVFGKMFSLLDLQAIHQIIIENLK